MILAFASTCAVINPQKREHSECAGAQTLGVALGALTAED